MSSLRNNRLTILISTNITYSQVLKRYIATEKNYLSLLSDNKQATSYMYNLFLSISNLLPFHWRNGLFYVSLHSWYQGGKEENLMIYLLVLRKQKPAKNKLKVRLKQEASEFRASLSSQDSVKGFRCLHLTILLLKLF